MGACSSTAAGKAAVPSEASYSTSREPVKKKNSSALNARPKMAETPAGGEATRTSQATLPTHEQDGESDSSDATSGGPASRTAPKSSASEGEPSSSQQQGDGGGVGGGSGGGAQGEQQAGSDRRRKSIQGRQDSVEREKMMNLHSRAKANTRAANRGNVFASKIDMSIHHKVPTYPKSTDDFEFLDLAVSDNFIFQTLDDSERRRLIDAMQKEEVSEGKEIITQGDIGDFFYVLEEGTVAFIVDGKNEGSCTNGAAFGELALLYNCPRAATCLAETDCTLWKVDQKSFRYILATGSIQEDERQGKDLKEMLRKVPFLAEVEGDALDQIVDASTTATFSEGDAIVKKGDAGEMFYVLSDGQVKVHNIGFGDSRFEDQFLRPGQWFGEQALLDNEKRNADVTAIASCTTLCLSREMFAKILGPLREKIEHSIKRRELMAIPIFNNSKFQPHEEMAKLVDDYTELTFQKGAMIAEEGEVAQQNLYIIRRGRIVVASSNGKICNLSVGDYFGESTLQEDDEVMSQQTVTAVEQTVCSVLSKDAIVGVIGTVSKLGKPVPVSMSKLDKTVRLEDVKKVRIIGVGTFGKVWLVSRSNSRTPYALKMLNKREILAHNQVEGVVREKNILSSIDHPFVVNLVATFQDDKSLYMLIELVQGGELYSVVHTDTRHGIPNANARFYAAGILEALSHLHNRHICYRDLKLENVLIDSRGYGVLVDLGFAKIVLDKTYTLCGTPEYLAPEIFLSKGHDKGVDYWAWGVLIYEMLVGESPFFKDGSDQVSLFRRIVQVKYSFPPGGVVNAAAQDLVQRLIVRRQSDRFGCLEGGDQDIRDHAWFSVIDFEKLLRKEVLSPWIPQIRDPLDASHFDSYKHIEDEGPCMKPPLNPQKQKLFHGF